MSPPVVATDVSEKSDLSGGGLTVSFAHLVDGCLDFSLLGLVGLEHILDEGLLDAEELGELPLHACGVQQVVRSWCHDNLCLYTPTEPFDAMYTSSTDRIEKQLMILCIICLPHTNIYKTADNKLQFTGR